VKICSKCKIMKVNAEYHKNKAQPDGMSGECKVCRKTTLTPKANKKAFNKWWANNKEKHNNKRRLTEEQVIDKFIKKKITKRNTLKRRIKILTNAINTLKSQKISED